MLPETAALDAALARAGMEDVVLRRTSGVAPSVTNYDVTVRAAVRSYSPSELVGGIAETDRLVIISPTQILAANWPNGAPENIPRRLDKVVIAGAVNNVESVNPIFIGSELVRIEMRVRGSSPVSIPQT